jgi:hypothetical protein
MAIGKYVEANGACHNYSRGEVTLANCHLSY